ncbi:MAG: hypothetical protein HY243_15485 [Proteobacteria bacterium]|nr:hypothetical protein [Pseudomonadota bacterium]
MNGRLLTMTALALGIAMQAAHADERVAVSETGSNNYSYVSVIHSGNSIQVTKIANAGQGSVSSTYTLGSSSREAMDSGAADTATRPPRPMIERAMRPHWFRGWQRTVQSGD